MAEYKTRSFSRTPQNTPILLQTSLDDAADRHRAAGDRQAIMHNCGIGGLYFEADYAVQPGTSVSITVLPRFPSRPGKTDGPHKVHRGKVRWCKFVGSSREAVYGIGVEIYETVMQAAVKSSRFQ